MKTRLAGLLILVLTAVALVVPQSASATQSWSRLMLSRNGHDWTTNLDAPLFRRPVTLSPGSKRVRTFYVRNQSGSAARLRVVVRVKNEQGLLEHDSFRMGVRTRSGHWHRIRHSGRQKVAHLRLARGRMVPVTVRVRMKPIAGNNTMDGQLRFVTRVRLSKRG